MAGPPIPWVALAPRLHPFHMLRITEVGSVFRLPAPASLAGPFAGHTAGRFLAVTLAVTVPVVRHIGPVTMPALEALSSRLHGANMNPKTSLPRQGDGEGSGGLVVRDSYRRWPERDQAGNAIGFFTRVPGLSFNDAMRQITPARSGTSTARWPRRAMMPQSSPEPMPHAKTSAVTMPGRKTHPGTAR